MKTAALLLTALLLPAIAGAQALPIEPGYWEHRFDLKTASGRIESALAMVRAQMDLLPPQQRQLLEATLRSQGVEPEWLDQRLLHCLTAEDIARGQVQLAEEGGCTLHSAATSDGSTRIDFACTEGDSRGTLLLHDATRYTGEASMELDFNGIEEAATATLTGRWLAASCPAASP